MAPSTRGRSDTGDSEPSSMIPRDLPFVDLLEMKLASVDHGQLLDHVFSELAASRGGWLVTANLDFLRRYRRDPDARELYDRADIRVADGMPLVWATWLTGTPLPERIAGSSLIEPLAARAAREGRSLYLLGGSGSAAEASAAVLTARHPRLRIVGHSSPEVSDPPTAQQIAGVLAELDRARPDLLLVGLGSPKQERLIALVRAHAPSTWMMGVGISFSFLAGQVTRAPEWMRRSGLEWVHRLAQEPRRLARRYLREDAPFALELFARSLAQRLTSRLHRPQE